MIRDISLSIIAAILILLLWFSYGRAQSLAPTMSCDVVVNGHTITFPKGWLSLKDCQALMNDLRLKDETEANIECVCQIGSKT